MKLLVVFLVCFTAEVFSQQMPNFFANMETVKSDCITESSVRPDLVDRLFQAGEFNPDNNLKCFIKCVFVKANAMSDAGIIQADIWRAQFPPALAQSSVSIAVDKCKGQPGVDACDTAFNRRTIAPFESECIYQTGVEEKFIDQFYKNGKMSNDPLWKCFLLCVNFKLQISGSTGEVYVEKVLETFDYVDLPSVQKCANIEEPDPCQKAHRYVKCIDEEVSKKFPL
ncbi:hypothetical protein ILUMI_25020 [Ignelater luminosus]|uniref:Uncharacterized protein n=1 Tax=Ignelater luminosus TaxID=2038154 RepID=A0A8K0G028_IGNLU|nr:hypothetical protein ILUMI_25020 [Ignelater luminosus]